MAVNSNNRTREGNDEVYFEIKSHIGVLAEYQTGWKKEVNVVSWNGGSPKYDIRDWSPDHERMSRGITLHEEEARRLAAHLADRFVKGKSSNVQKQDVVLEEQKKQGSEVEESKQEAVADEMDALNECDDEPEQEDECIPA